MEQSPQQVVRDFLRAVQHGDQAHLAAALHPQVQWSQPGHNRFAGLKASRDEVFQMVGGMYQLTHNTLQLTKADVLAVNGNSVACLVHWQAGQPTGSVLSVDNIDVYTVEKGQIVRATVYSADLAQEDQFWAR
jgi:ketosteroid isomerase-like protein